MSKCKIFTAPYILSARGRGSQVMQTLCKNNHWLKTKSCWESLKRKGPAAPPQIIQLAHDFSSSALVWCVKPNHAHGGRRVEVITWQSRSRVSLSFEPPPPPGGDINARYIYFPPECRRSPAGHRWLHTAPHSRPTHVMRPRSPTSRDAGGAVAARHVFGRKPDALDSVKEFLFKRRGRMPWRFSCHLVDTPLRFSKTPCDGFSTSHGCDFGRRARLRVAFHMAVLYEPSSKRKEG